MRSLRDIANLYEHATEVSIVRTFACHYCSRTTALGTERERSLRAIGPSGGAGWSRDHHRQAQRRQIQPAQPAPRPRSCHFLGHPRYHPRHYRSDREHHGRDSLRPDGADVSAGDARSQLAGYGRAHSARRRGNQRGAGGASLEQLYRLGDSAINVCFSRKRYTRYSLGCSSTGGP